MKSIANNLILDEVQHNCIPHPYSNKKEDLKPSSMWNEVTNINLVLRANTYLRQFN